MGCVPLLNVTNASIISRRFYKYESVGVGTMNTRSETPYLGWDLKIAYALHIVQNREL
jgi:hypothetical protein